MPYLFARQGADWQALTITACSGYVACVRPAFLPARDADPPRALPFLSRLDREGGDNRWVLVVPGGMSLHHNGRPVTSGLRALAHRDAFAVEGGPTLFFSTEERATVQPFAGPARLQCPRCRGDLVPGAPAVRCPACQVVHHEEPDRKCWTYSAICAACSHPTALDADLSWTPATF